MAPQFPPEESSGAFASSDLCKETLRAGRSKEVFHVEHPKILIRGVCRTF